MKDILPADKKPVFSSSYWKTSEVLRKKNNNNLITNKAIFIFLSTNDSRTTAVV
jgi:hypothetical protein